MKKLKTWQIVLLIIFYPVGLIYLCYWLYKKFAIKNKVDKFLNPIPIISENFLPKTVKNIPLAYEYEQDICFTENTQKYVSTNIGQPISFVKEPNNPTDPHAVAIYLNNKKIGYVNRGQVQNMINGWIHNNDYFTGFMSAYYPAENRATYKIGFYKENEVKKESTKITFNSQKVNIFTKRWSNACRKEFIVLDFETTGLSDKTDRIIEIAAVKYENGTPTDKFTSFVNPLMHISSSATKVNNITDDMVADAPTEKDIIPQLIEFLSDSLIIGHNVSFDLRFLEMAAHRCKIDVKYNYIDTVSVSRKLFPELPNHKLGTVAEHLDIVSEPLHRAEADAEVCAEIIKIALENQIVTK